MRELVLFITGPTGVDDLVEEKLLGMRGSPVEEIENGVIDVLFAKGMLEETDGL